MVDYLEQFFREKILPYRIAIEALPLEFRVGIAENIKSILIESMLKKEKLVLPAKLDERLTSIYALTAKLGRDLGSLLLEKSGPNLRIGEDYAKVYSEVMALFGEDAERNKEIILKLLKEEIGRDRILREAGIGPWHISAIWN